MAVPEFSKFRLKEPDLEALNSLAASNGGNNTQALKEAVAQWHAAVIEGGHINAEELSEEDWVRLGHLNDPGPFSGPDIEDGSGRHGMDWSQHLAHELLGMYEGRPLVLPSHKIEAKACRELAERVAQMGRVRGYAMMAALRYFWRTPDAGILACAEPAVWMTPTAKG